MKPAFLLAWLTGATPGYALAQIVLYEQNFDAAAPPALPADWFATSPAVFTEMPVGSPSAGYPGASGGQCLVALNCNPNGETRQVQVSNVSTLGVAGLILSFGHRRTSTFTPAVSLHWSADGSTWLPIDYNSATASTTWTRFSSAALPLAAQNQPSISLRWMYTTQVTNTACQSFAGNYRIDDVRLTASTLPLELEDFEAYTNPDDGVTLYWQTRTETEHLYFEVERSADGQAFETIGRVAGAGTSKATHTYTFDDPAPLPGRNYYRLQFVDFAGNSTYSPQRSVDRPASADGWLVYPSPADAVLFVRPSAASVPARLDWDVFDESGRSVLSGAIAENAPAPHRLNIESLRPGLYGLRLARERTIWWKLFLKW